MGRRIRWLGIVLIVLFGVVLSSWAISNSTRPAHWRATRRTRATPRSSSTTSAARFWRPTAPCSPSRFPPRAGPTSTSGLSAGLLVLPARRLRLLHLRDQRHRGPVQRLPGRHTQPAQSLAQLLSPPPKTTDDVTLTINPTLQKTAQEALHRPRASTRTVRSWHSTRRPGRCSPCTRTRRTTRTHSHLLRPRSRPRRGSPTRQGRRRFLTLVAHRHRGHLPPGSTFQGHHHRLGLRPPTAALELLGTGAHLHRRLPQSNQKLCNDGNTPCGRDESNRCCRHRVTPATPCSASRSARNRSTSRPSLRLQHGSAPRHPRRCRLALPVGDRPRPGQPGVAGRRLLGHRPAGCGGERATKRPGGGRHCQPWDGDGTPPHGPDHSVGGQRRQHLQAPTPGRVAATPATTAKITRSCNRW